jgi:acetyl esterase/lipase
MSRSERIESLLQSSWPRLYAGLLAGVVVIAVARAQSPRPEGVRVIKDIAYAHADEKAERLDLYLPEKAGEALPVIVWVHGGGWIGGSKTPCPAELLVKRGYAVASVEYRFAPGARYPAQIEDCKAAVRWLRAHAEEYHLDQRRFGAWGASAGGHLVALLGTTGDVKELEGDLGNAGQSSRVQAVCDWFGPTDFTKIGEFPSQIKHYAPDSPEAKLLGGPVLENRDKAARANPITYVSKDDPPFLIMHGDKDPLVPLNQSELLRDALKKEGVEVTLHVVPGAGHGFAGPEIARMVMEFFDRHLKPRP